MSKKFRELRIQAGLTQSALAEEAKVSPAFIYKLEAGEYTTLSIDKSHDLAKGLGLTLRDFLEAIGLMRDTSTPNADHALMSALRTRTSSLSEAKIKQIISYVEFVEHDK
jgi:transcriptional regulator with XRE-family HTH domain